MINARLSDPRGPFFCAENFFSFLSENIVAPLLCTLRHLSAHHKLSQDVRNDIIRLSGLELVIKILQLSSNWPILKVGIEGSKLSTSIFSLRKHE